MALIQIGLINEAEKEIIKLNKSINENAPELNLGQLAMIIRSKFLVDAISLSKIQGKPFTQTEVYNKIKKIIKEIK